MIDGGLFARAVQLIPTDLPLLRDPAYYRDRGDFIGAELTRESMFRNRPESVVEVRAAFELFEHAVLADGRAWVLGSERPGLADVEAVWPFHWLTGMKGALPGEVISRETYPRVFAWVARFQEVVSRARKEMEKPTSVNGDEALGIITGSAWNEDDAAVDPSDPVVQAEGLRAGDVVTVHPTDTGSSHREVGTLVSMTLTEVVIAVRAEDANRSAIRVHAPRHGFRVQAGAVKVTDQKL